MGPQNRSAPWALPLITAHQIREDPVYPITEVNEQPLDLCLGHNQQDSDSGMYHCHSISPCLNSGFLQGKNMADCTSNEEHSRDATEWAISLGLQPKGR